MQARLQTKWLRMLFALAYGETTVSGGRDVFLRKLPYGTTEEIPVKSVRSHIVKHGASDNAAASGVPWPVSMQVIAPHSFHVMSQSIRISLLTAPLIQSPCARQLEHHANKSQFRTYQKKEALDLAESRQLLNAPPGLRRTDRVFSNLDVMLAVKMELTRANHSHALEVRIPPLEVSSFVSPSIPKAFTVCIHIAHTSIHIGPNVYTSTQLCIHIITVFTHTATLPSIHIQSACIHIHTNEYTHLLCLYTHLLTTPVGGASAAQHDGDGQGGVIPAADADESLV